MSYEKYKQGYTNLLDTMKVRAEWLDPIDRRARAILANKSRYQKVADQVGVPWEFIGITHSLEGGLNFNTALHNGDLVIGNGKKTYRVPKGRGPFSTWEEAAVDALKIKKLDLIVEWPIERILYELERYNGFGYRRRDINIPSPYLWSGTTHYTIGKYVSDGKYVKTAKSAQSGAVPLLLRIRELDITKKEIIKNSTRLSWYSRLKTWLAAGGLSTAFTDAMGWLEPYKQFIIEHKYFFLAGTVVGGFILFNFLQNKSIKEYEEGRYIPSGQETKMEIE